MSTQAASTQRRGFLAAAAAFFVWGLFPLYWHQLAQVPAPQIIAHRVLWCAVFVNGYLCLRQGLGWIPPLLRRQVLLPVLASATLISVNWLLYVWAVNAGHVVETSLGYYINPLFSVLLGVLVLGERPRPAQWAALLLAACGVAYLTWAHGRLPWIALALAASFGLYGLIRKLVPVGSVPGLALESLYGLPLSLGYLLLMERWGQGAFGHAPGAITALLVLCGVVTALPLIWFAYAARQIPYSSVGLMQFIAPSLQFVCGVWVFGEDFGRAQVVGFGLIWAALALYVADLLRSARAARPARATPRAASRSVSDPASAPVE